MLALCVGLAYIDCPDNQYGPVLHLLTILCISDIVHHAHGCVCQLVIKENDDDDDDDS